MRNAIFFIPMLLFTCIYNPEVNYCRGKWSEKCPLSSFDIIQYIKKGVWGKKKKKSFLFQIYLFFFRKICQEDSLCKENIYLIILIIIIILVKGVGMKKC